MKKFILFFVGLSSSLCLADKHVQWSTTVQAPVFSTVKTCDNLDDINKIVAAQCFARDSEGRTPLIAAVIAGCTPAVQRLIGLGADVNAQDSLPAKEHASILDEWLSEDGAVRVFDGQTALMYAAQLHPSLIPLLVKAGADYNLQDADGISPMMMALCNDQEESVRNLLACNADLTLTEESGLTAVDVLLLNEKVPVDVKRKMLALALLPYALIASSEQWKKTQEAARYSLSNDKVVMNLFDRANDARRQAFAVRKKLPPHVQVRQPLKIRR